MTLCEIPAPSQELVDKYDSLKSTFLKRMMNAFDKVSKSPVVESQREAVRAFAGDVGTRPELDAASKVARWGLLKKESSRKDPVDVSGKTIVLKDEQQWQLQICFKSFFFPSALAEEALPLMDKARSSVLGLYEHYLRPYVGNSLSNGIDHIKVYLDKYLPAE